MTDLPNLSTRDNEHESFRDVLLFELANRGHFHAFLSVPLSCLRGLLECWRVARPRVLGTHCSVASRWEGLILQLCGVIILSAQWCMKWVEQRRFGRRPAEGKELGLLRPAPFTRYSEGLDVVGWTLRSNVTQSIVALPGTQRANSLVVFPEDARPLTVVDNEQECRCSVVAARPASCSGEEDGRENGFAQRCIFLDVAEHTYGEKPGDLAGLRSRNPHMANPFFLIQAYFFVFSTQRVRNQPSRHSFSDRHRKTEFRKNLLEDSHHLRYTFLGVATWDIDF